MNMSIARLSVVYIIIFRLSSVQLALGCSIAGGWLGVFIGQVRPLQSDANLLWARFDVHTLEGGAFQPLEQREAIIDLQTGDVTPLTEPLQEDDFYPSPNGEEANQENQNENENYALSVDWPNAVLRTPRGTEMFETAFQLKTPDGSVVSLQAPHRYFHFFSEKFGLLYLFYQAGFNYENVYLSIFDIRSEGDILGSRVTSLVEGLPYILEPEQAFFPTVYEDLQLVAFYGNGADCNGRFFVYYHETGAILSMTDTIIARSDVLQTIVSAEESQASENSFFLASTAVENYSGTVCVGRTVSRDGGLLPEATTIREYLVSDPNTILRQMSIDSNELAKVLGVTSIVPSPTSCRNVGGAMRRLVLNRRAARVNGNRRAVPMTDFVK